ncbi:MAG: PrsW family intramembrane metalloprotease [Candidatus Aminicenantes bacterium]|nr:PrsW family intramembrane metalloprotease [Candidatus Aminicenantes bacterium]
MSFLVLLALAVAPGLALAAYLHSRDLYEKEPSRKLIKAFLLGSGSVFVAAGIEMILGDSNALVEAFLFVGLTEELCKFFVLMVFFYHEPVFDEPFDGIVYAGFISLGFATLENISYVMGKGLAVAVVRMFLAVPAHAIFGIVMGFFAGGAKFYAKRKTGLLVMALLAPAFLHGLYDFFLMVNVSGLVVFSMILVAAGVMLSLRAIRIRIKESPYRPGGPAGKAVHQDTRPPDAP